MTGSIIERAARALAEAESGRDDWDTLDTQRQEGIRRNVRTVLHAIREPSDAMATAGAGVISAVDTTETGKAYAGEAASTWRFMVAAAMDEQ